MLVWSVGESLITIGIGAFLNHIVSRVKRSRRSRHVTEFWDFARGREVFVVLPKTQELPDHDSGLTAEKSLNIHSALALGLVREHLLAMGAKPKIHASEHGLLPQIDKADLVLIGGTLGNEVCMKKCAVIKDQLEFYWFDALHKRKPRVLRHWRDQDRKYKTTLHREKGDGPQEGGIEEDYGLVLKFENPSDNQRRIIVLAGNYGTGTLAATRAALDDSLLGEVREGRDLKNSVGFVVEGHRMAWDVTRWALRDKPFGIGENTGSRGAPPPREYVPI